MTREQHKVGSIFMHEGIKYTIVGSHRSMKNAKVDHDEWKARRGTTILAKVALHTENSRILVLAWGYDTSHLNASANGKLQ